MRLDSQNNSSMPFSHTFSKCAAPHARVRPKCTSCHHMPGTRATARDCRCHFLTKENMSFVFQVIKSTEAENLIIPAQVGLAFCHTCMIHRTQTHRRTGRSPGQHRIPTSLGQVLIPAEAWLVISCKRINISASLKCSVILCARVCVCVCVCVCVGISLNNKSRTTHAGKGTNEETVCERNFLRVRVLLQSFFCQRVIVGKEAQKRRTSFCFTREQPANLFVNVQNHNTSSNTLARQNDWQLQQNHNTERKCGANVCFESIHLLYCPRPGVVGLVTCSFVIRTGHHLW